MKKPKRLNLRRWQREVVCDGCGWTGIPSAAVRDFLGGLIDGDRNYVGCPRCDGATATFAHPVEARPA